jgi:hypothetical protein
MWMGQHIIIAKMFEKEVNLLKREKNNNQQKKMLVSSGSIFKKNSIKDFF